MKDVEIFPGRVKPVSYMKRYSKKREFKLIQSIYRQAIKLSQLDKLQSSGQRPQSVSPKPSPSTGAEVPGSAYLEHDGLVSKAFCYTQNWAELRKQCHRTKLCST